MRIVTEAVAGTLESSDVIVRVSPAPGGPGGGPADGHAGGGAEGADAAEATLEIAVTSSVMAQFGDAIREVVMDTVSRLGLTHGRVVVEDKGALDCTLRARVQAACLRGAGRPDEIDWSAL